MRVRTEYACDWNSATGDDQRGHIKVTTPTGVIEATWSCTGGMGDGADLVSNTTQELDDEAAHELVNAADTCQGLGVYDADIGRDEYGWPTLEHVTWLDPQPA